MVITTFSKVVTDVLRNKWFFYAIIVTAAPLTVQGGKGQPNGSLEIAHEGYRSRNSTRYNEKYDRDTFVAR